MSVPEPTATPAPVGPVAATTLSVYLGPSDKYEVVGQIARGAHVEVVGRDSTGSWLAVNFTPGAKLNGWVQASEVVGIVDVGALPEAPVTPLT